MQAQQALQNRRTKLWIKMFDLYIKLINLIYLHDHSSHKAHVFSLLYISDDIQVPQVLGLLNFFIYQLLLYDVTKI